MTTLNTNENYLMELKLHGIRNNLSYRLKDGLDEKLGYEEFLGLCLFDEIEHRRNVKIQRLIYAATFRSSATPEGIDFAASRSIDKKQIAELSTSRFIRDGHNLLIIGPTGVGKSYLATAIAMAACRNRHSTLFFRMNTLIEKLSLVRASGNYLNFLKRLSTVDLIVLDDFGLKPLLPQHYQDLYDILDERIETKSTIVTTQLPEENWGEVIEDPVTCEAITRRIVEKAIRIEIKGKSYVKMGKGLTKTDPS
ncbi:MAG: ATP-binding protein [Deltaproteobacteria bacterium]|nr:ATP-binding protein [Deltaproteobacteria bacterium]